MTKSILIFRTGQLGDTLVAMPAMHEIRRRHPEHRLILLTDLRKHTAFNVTSWDVLEPTGWFDHVIHYNPAEGVARKLLSFFRVGRSIRKTSPEIIYDLVFPRADPLRRRHFLFFRWIAGIPQHRGYAESKKPPRNPDGLLPRVEPEWKRLLRVAGAADQEISFHLQIPESAQETAASVLKAKGLFEGNRIIGLGPGSGMPAKRWPEERFVDLARQMLQENEGANVLILGGKEDAALGQRLQQRLGERVHDLAGELSVYESAAILKACTAYVGNDTGTLHLAAMVGTPCVALFTARDYPGMWEPYGKNHVIIRRETDCAGCMLTVCDAYKNRCLGLITADEVFEALRKVLRNRASDKAVQHYRLSAAQSLGLSRSPGRRVP